MNAHSFSIVVIDDQSSNHDTTQNQSDISPQSETRASRSHIIVGSTGLNNGPKRQKDISPCYVCGAKAHGYNFDQITCESCKAFFRRNALKSLDKFRCRNNNNCAITETTRKRCKRCRIIKCFKVGMRKEWILTDEEKRLKRKKIERNRLLKQQQQDSEKVSLHPKQNVSSSTFIPEHQQSTKPPHSNSLVSNKSQILPLPMMCMYRAMDQKMYERQHYLLQQLSNGYQMICQRYPQPQKLLYRNSLISETGDSYTKLTLIKDLTRELTQMTTSRLLHYFTLIPEFQLLNEYEKKSILIKNMLAVFMFHGALTYNAENDTFVDWTTADQPYQAKYLLFVYGRKIYNSFTDLARKLTYVAYQSTCDKKADERSHTLFLLLMAILLFSDGFEVDVDSVSIGNVQHQSIEYESSRPSMSRSLSTNSESASSTISSQSSSNSFFSATKLNEKLHKIQRIYVELACRYLHDEFGLSIGGQMFKNLVPLLYDLKKLCSTLANVNLCELVEDEDSSSSSRITSSLVSTHNARSSTQTSTQFSSAMISGTAHFNELQKENRAPPSPPPPRTPSPPVVHASSPPYNRPSLINVNAQSSSPSIRSSTFPPYENY